MNDVNVVCAPLTHALASVLGEPNAPGASIAPDEFEGFSRIHGNKLDRVDVMSSCVLDRYRPSPA